MPTRLVDNVSKADGGDIQVDGPRYRRLAMAALKPMTRPSEAMVDAAHEAVWFDAEWAINSRRDFRKAVRAMIGAALKDGERKGPGS